jgi:hypothetical protein
LPGGYDVQSDKTKGEQRPHKNLLETGDWSEHMQLLF